MLTPLFEIMQFDDLINVLIKAPLAKISSTQIEVCDKELFFSSKPYFLRLYLPCFLCNETEPKASYDSDSGTFTIIVNKRNKDEHFPGLDFVTKLLTPPGRSDIKALIEEVDPETDLNQSLIDDPVVFEQELPTGVPSTSKFRYGFANSKTEIFARLRDEIAYDFDVKNPDNISIDDRKRLATDDESEKFSDDHYLADLYANEEISTILTFNPWWKSSSLNLTSEERDRLKDLPQKLIISPLAENSPIYYSLVDILFAYAYNSRSTLGENTSESGWLISKLSGTLSWFISWESLAECVRSCFRRSLTFPLQRRWDLSLALLNDVIDILDNGPVCVLKCLLEIHKIFANAGEYRYVLNELYIADYCVWLQYEKDEQLRKLCSELSQIEISKADLEFELEELELAAKLTIEEENEKIHSTVEKLSAMKLNGKEVDSDDSECD